MLMAGFSGQSFLYHKRKDISKAKNSAIILVMLLLTMTLYGYLRLARNPTTFTDKKIRLVQCNISQEKKENQQYAYSNLQEHLMHSIHNEKVDIVIWPEASIPYLYHENFKQLHDYLRSPLQESEYLLAGAVRKDQRTQKIHNSVVVINHSGENVAIYDKVRLLPFGEYIPCRKYIPVQIQSIASEIGDFDEGSRTALLNVGGLKIAVAICYEIVFPRSIMPCTADVAIFSQCHEADVIVNPTNDGWFGYTTGPFQHLQISRARAVEAGIPLVRATNYGISAIFDSCGREVARIPINKREAINANIPVKIYSLIHSANEVRGGFFLLLLLISIWGIRPVKKSDTDGMC